MGFGILGKEQVIERWDTLVAGADGKGESVMEGAERLLDDSKVPDVKMQRRSMSPGVVQGLRGGKRPFVVVSNISNPNLKPYRMYINTRDYGVNLQVSWYLVHQPSFWEKFTGFILSIPVLGLLMLPAYSIGKSFSFREAGVLGLNLFHEQDLRAYVSNAHNCLTESVDNLTRGDEVEAPRVEKHSQGFLGIV